jgi:hypothetical protein
MNERIQKMIEWIQKNAITIVVSILFSILFIFLLLYGLFELSKEATVPGAIVLGLSLIVLGFGSLLCTLEISAKGDTNLSLVATKSAYTLVVGGLIIIILGLLYLMMLKIPTLR